MYLACEKKSGKVSYWLKVSLYDDVKEIYLPHRVFEFGENPANYVEEHYENCFVFHEELVAAVQPYCDGDPEKILETLMYDFFTGEHKRQVNHSLCRKNFSVSSFTDADKVAIEKEVHLFDLKRLYYLRYGAVDQGHLHKMHNKLARKLLGMSRDEKECYFEVQERELPVTELKTYAYAIFDVQHHFSQSFAPFMPGALVQEEVEDCFLSELCRLNDDDVFLLGELSGGVLYHHLKRYVIMFFDYDYEQRTFEQDFIRRFRAEHRTFKWPERKHKIDDAVIIKLFGISAQQLQEMDEKQLGKLYRKRAMQLHPDKGGDHETFISLTEAYEQLLAFGK